MVKTACFKCTNFSCYNERVTWFFHNISDLMSGYLSRCTCDERVYFSCLHHLSVLVSFCRVFCKHLSNTQLLFWVVDFLWFFIIFICGSICVLVACRIERCGGELLDEGGFNAVGAQYYFFVIQQNSGRLLVHISTLKEPSQGGGLEGPFDSIAAKENMSSMLEPWIQVRNRLLGASWNGL